MDEARLAFSLEVAEQTAYVNLVECFPQKSVGHTEQHGAQCDDGEE